VTRKLTAVFWIEAVGSTVCTALFAVTLAWPTWVELVFHADPDHGSGLLEWSILVVALAAALWLSVAARREWERVRRYPVIGSGPA